MIGATATKATLHVDDNRCQVCRRCLAQQVCKIKAIVRVDLDEPPFIDVHRCYGCMVCLSQCPSDAISTT